MMKRWLVLLFLLTLAPMASQAAETLTGKITDPDERPVKGLLIRIVDSEGRPVAGAVARAQAEPDDPEHPEPVEWTGDERTDRVDGIVARLEEEP